MNDIKAILDFEDSEFPDLDLKLIDAIEKHKKLYPVDISIVAEYDEVMIFFSLRDKDNNSYPVGKTSMSSNDFTALMQDAGFKPDMSGYEKMSEQEKEELIEESKEDMKQNPFKDKVKELEESD